MNALCVLPMICAHCNMPLRVFLLVEVVCLIFLWAPKPNLFSEKDSPGLPLRAAKCLLINAVFLSLWDIYTKGRTNQKAV